MTAGGGVVGSRMPTTRAGAWLDLWLFDLDAAAELPNPPDLSRPHAFRATARPGARSLGVGPCPPRGLSSPWDGPAALTGPHAPPLHVGRCPPRGPQSPWDGPAALSPQEHQRAQRMLNDTPRHHYQVARSLWRHTLAGYLGCAPAAVPLVTGPGGKPVLHGGGLHTGISHSATRLAVAVSNGVVGVDLVARQSRSPRPVCRALQPAQCAAIDALPDSGARERAFRLWWACNEAVVKASGEGLSFTLCSAPPAMTQGGAWVYHRAQRWWVWAPPLPGGAHAVVATPAAVGRFRLLDGQAHTAADNALNAAADRGLPAPGRAPGPSPAGSSI